MFTNTVLVIWICVGIYYLISYYCKRLPIIRAGNALPGPKAKPIIGNAYYLLEKNFDEFLNGMCLLADTYPSPFRFWLGNKLHILVTEPDQIKTILQSRSCLNKSALYDIFKAGLGTGILTAPAPIWAKHRKMIASSLNTNILRVFCNTFVEQASILMDKLEHVVGDEVDLLHYVTMCTLDIIYGTSLGMKLEAQSNQNFFFVKALERLKQIVMHRIRNVFLFPDIIFNLTPLKREQQKLVNYIHSFAEKVIQQKEDARHNNLHSTQDKCAKRARRIFLDILMEASDKGQKFTRKNILDEINTMSLTGTDTIGITMNFIIFMIANFPEVQEKVYKELLKIYGTQDPKSAPVKFNDLQHMNYLERVIKETLRLFPVAPLIGRRLTEDLKIGRTLPKGVNFVIVILALHRNEKYWPNALTFDPDRFLPENMTNIHPYSYIPFSNGPRNCIGIKYAMTSMKVIIATLLRTYILKVDKKVDIDEIKLKMNITLTPLDPLKVKIEKRH